MMFFINAKLTAGPPTLNAIDIWNEPDKKWIVTVQIDRGTEYHEYIHFYGPNEQDVKSKADLFVNALGNCRVLQKIEDILNNESIIKVDELLTLIKTSHRWN